MNKHLFYLFRFLILLLIYSPIISLGQDEGVYKNIDSAINNPSNVKILDLSKQKIQTFPKEILSFANLNKLILKRNYIKEIPKEINSLKNLHYIDISSNKIEFLPVEMGFMKLDTLIMWDNPIRSFPQEFQNMGASLRYLDMRAILMNRKEQKQIKLLFPQARIRLASPCNCK